MAGGGMPVVKCIAIYHAYWRTNQHDLGNENWLDCVTRQTGESTPPPCPWRMTWRWWLPGQCRDTCAFRTLSLKRRTEKWRLAAKPSGIREQNWTSGAQPSPSVLMTRACIWQRAFSGLKRTSRSLKGPAGVPIIRENQFMTTSPTVCWTETGSLVSLNLKK